MRSVNGCPTSKLTHFRAPNTHVTKSKPVTHFVCHVGSARGLVLWGSPTLPPAGVPGVSRRPEGSRRVGRLGSSLGEGPPPGPLPSGRLGDASHAPRPPLGSDQTGGVPAGMHWGSGDRNKKAGLYRILNVYYLSIYIYMIRIWEHVWGRELFS